MMENEEGKKSKLQIAIAVTLGAMAIGCLIASFFNPQHLITALICIMFILCIWYND